MQVRTGQQQSPYIETLKKAEEAAQASGLGVWTKVRESAHEHAQTDAPAQQTSALQGHDVMYLCMLYAVLTQEPGASSAAVRDVPAAEGKSMRIHLRTQSTPHAHSMVAW